MTSQESNAGLPFPNVYELSWGKVIGEGANALVMGAVCMAAGGIEAGVVGALGTLVVKGVGHPVMRTIVNHRFMAANEVGDGTLE